MEEKIKTLIQRERSHLTEKKEHTKHKILYVCEYVKEWLYVSCNSQNDNLNFIDCMSNAGIYADGEFCTAIEVIKIFCERAPHHDDKVFNVLLNDIDAKRIEIAKEVCKIIIDKLPHNVHVYFDNQDVNEYLRTLKQRYNIFAYPSKTILFVDPFDFRTVHIPTLREYLENAYCELIFNMFTSDFVRNGVDKGIANSLGGNYTFDSKDALWQHVAETLTTGRMKYCLSYPFRNSKNVELYQILFLTPSDKGLDKLKQAIWNTFNGQDYFRADRVAAGQLSLFSPLDDKDYRAKIYAEDAFDLLYTRFAGSTLTYAQIEHLILGHSLLMSSQIINYVIKPKITARQLVKQNLNGKSNYRQDSYYIVEKGR